MNNDPNHALLSIVDIADLDFAAADLDIEKAAAAYREHGCIVVRGLMKPHLEEMSRQINRVLEETITQIDDAKPIPAGWLTPNGALLLPAPEHFERDKQIMCLPINYYNSAAFMRTALDPTTLDLAEAILGPDIELFGDGQSLVKEAIGGHPKHLHQDGAYFEHRYEGPLGQLTYVVDTNLENGCLHVVPGSFKMGLLEHEDTFSHLGLNEKTWPWERSTPIEGKAGDSIFFHINCIHGSKPNESSEPRPVFINRYRDADDYVIITTDDRKNPAEAEKRAAEASKENQQGLMVRGFRRYDASRK
jgi:hypothetical protein